MSPRYQFSIGLTALTMTNVESLVVKPAIPAPRYMHRHTQEAVPTGSGASIWLGYPSLIWWWAFLTRDQRNLLRANYITGASASLYIYTLTPNSSSYKTYSCIGHWPTEEQIENDHVLDFQLVFTHLLEVP